MVEVYLYGEWRALARSEVRGQIAEVKNKGVEWTPILRQPVKP
jgi:hypothetical protein